MDAPTRQYVRRRADNRCEYCGIPQEVTSFIPFHVEHIRSRQHAGADDLDNLALACDRCNAYKGPNLGSFDPHTGELVSLFDPRKDDWSQHFLWERGTILGVTPKGRATVQLLNMNAPRRVQLREAWLEAGGQLR
jgi:hypothetical protein